MGEATVEGPLGAALFAHFAKGAVFDVAFLVCFASYSAHAPGGALRLANQPPQSHIDGPLVREMLSNIRREQYKVRPRSIARDILAAHPAFQLR